MSDQVIAIVESGSTKADWVIIRKGKAPLRVRTNGLNPFYQEPEAMTAYLQQTFKGSRWPSKLTSLHFYGAGCSDEARCQMITTALQPLFPQAAISVDHDLLAAARATCGHRPGIVCILGTGSNSGVYDGNRIIDNITNLGFLAGDEGSGAHLGKRLLQGYFYREMPKEICLAFEKKYGREKRHFLNQLYGEETPNVYLASFARFMADHRSQVYIRSLVARCFEEFIKRHLLKYKDARSVPIHFVGSIAYHFQSTLRLVLEIRRLKAEMILQKPIHQLIRFHTQPISKE